jgi:hypothetical protein
MQQLPLHLASIRKFGAWPIVQFLIPLSGPDGKVTPDKVHKRPIYASTRPEFQSLPGILLCRTGTFPYGEQRKLEIYTFSVSSCWINPTNSCAIKIRSHKNQIIF